ncbi:MAG: hypothetical protein JWN04_5430 [Myxococcaceae bacterium]|nr:hypothetical protein [Myxococcaceae bacterium]
MTPPKCSNADANSAQAIDARDHPTEAVYATCSPVAVTLLANNAGGSGFVGFL